MIIATLRMEIPPKEYGDALKILKSSAEYFRIQPGCSSCNIYEDLQEKNTILFSGTWRSSEILEMHLRSNEFRNILLVMEMAVKKPEIRFDEISASTGIETVEKARMYNR
jgi:quinol monooxygenase YgiN